MPKFAVTNDPKSALLIFLLLVFIFVVVVVVYILKFCSIIFLREDIKGLD